MIRAPGCSLLEGVARSGLTYEQVWVRYVGLGGVQPVPELRAEIEAHDPDGLDPFEHNLIAHTLNEYFTELDEDHPVAYRGAPG